MTTLLIAMGTFALSTSISPGPVNILATVTGANHGYVRTMPHITGATFGFVSILFLLGFGLSKFITQIPYLSESMTFLGGSFLLYLAYKVASQKPTTKNEDTELNSAAPSFLQGMMCQWLNPKAWIVSLAGISVFYTGQDLKLTVLLQFCAIFFVICYASISVWALLGVTIRTVLETPSQLRLFNLSMGLLLATTVLYTFFTSS
ncbi:LysE family translocator [Vibrio gangliei]|uniref:LysE family translocator n=1 Tax=Vibrio gangliei TaxID=2077090 RepID=UPI0022320F03|nr:LysE family translocator [Vibrio gangliei]